MRTKQQRFGADEVAVAVESFVTEDDRVVKHGGQLRGDDPLVRHAPHLFVRDGATDEEIGQARTALMPDYIEAINPSAAKLPLELKADNAHARW